MKKFVEKIFGTYSDKELKKITPMVGKIGAYEEEYRGLSTSQLKNKTNEFRERLKSGETPDDLLPEAFAAVREAADRVLGMRHFDVQLIGGIVLHQGRIAEMKTGEGKTLMSTLPAYLNALSGDGVHIVTVNDYLAKRDSEWMGKIYNYMGLSVGLIVNGLSSAERQAAYNSDITYATNNELGFDYLRDNMATMRERQSQRRNFAIVDEVDSILIDEARTPLIISGEGDKSTQLYEVADKFAKRLTKRIIVEADSKQHDDTITEDYVVDEKAKTVTLTEHGIKKAEAHFNITNLSDPENMLTSHHINQAIRAHGIMKRDKDYVVKDGEVIIVDEFTGRLMVGRRYSDGLHQAIEAKEGVKVERESKTLATITFQNFFRLYNKLSGMTGTAQTEEEEFQAIYSLDVVVIPTNKQLVREDFEDVVYKTTKGKDAAIIAQIEECHAKGQPVLVGTVSIDKSEEIARWLKRRGIKHEVLNAKFHEKEAEIVAQAGKFGAVTIATNMAGRGTDIVLGGNAEFMAKREMKKRDISDDLIVESTGFGDTDDEEILGARAIFSELNDKYKKEIQSEREKVLEAGGLFIIGTERHESRRIDNQLRGRSGRQGDAGASRFFISFEDDLMRLFGSDRIKGLLGAMPEDQPLEAKMLTGTIETAQRRIEGNHFDSRRYVLKFDDVMNVQRNLVYSQRQKVLEGEDIGSVITSYIDGVIDGIIGKIIVDADDSSTWSWQTFRELMEYTFGVKLRDFENMDAEELKEYARDEVMKVYSRKEEEFSKIPGGMQELERTVLLNIVDQKWMDHIDAMEQLRQGISLRGYAQKDPVIEYKFEGMAMFEDMVESIKEDTVRMILHASVQVQHSRKQAPAKVSETHGGGGSQGKAKPVQAKSEKVGRNEACTCGSGKKWKKCCGIS